MVTLLVDEFRTLKYDCVSEGKSLRDFERHGNHFRSVVLKFHLGTICSREEGPIRLSQKSSSSEFPREGWHNERSLVPIILPYRILNEDRTCA